MSERVPFYADERVDPTPRRQFLRRSAVITAAAGAAVMARPQALQAQFQGPTVGKTFAEIRKHENDHVAFLVQALGSHARPKPTFQNLDQSSEINFVNLSRTFENTGAGAYLGAAPALLSRQYLASAGSIALVEGRHAGFLNVLLNQPVTQNDESFETPLTASQVVAGVTPFIASLNGGPPVSYSNSPSPQNDISILNFALALEYLEAEYYNLNVPKFFPNATP